MKRSRKEVMMRIGPITTLALAAGLALPELAAAQSLGEAAAREREKRKGKPAGKVYTEVDLGRGGSPSPASSEPAAGATGEGPAAAPASEGAAKEAAAKDKSPEEIKAEQEKAWRERLKKANDDVARMTARMETLQRALNDLTQTLYGSTRTAQLNELEQLKQQLASTRQTIADIEEEGRRNGFRQ